MGTIMFLKMVVLFPVIFVRYSNLRCVVFSAVFDGIMEALILICTKVSRPTLDPEAQ